MAFGVSTGAPGSPCAFIQRSNSFRSLAKRLACDLSVARFFISYGSMAVR